MGNSTFMQEGEIAVRRNFSKFRIFISTLLIIVGSTLAILYFANFYSIYIKNNPAGIIDIREKNRWVHQIPVRYSFYCLAAGIVVLVPVSLSVLALVRKKEDYYKAAIGIIILFSIVRRFVE